ncbi:alpha/beta hydrolase [Rhodococcus spelaei]|uniref:Alpha/beta hydrolase n=2 Tax=Rhodococcus spelaei TaxID=2546320 RepID=A0A541BPS2_9NOCA|nr:alpha/beta hydrolase [Rhodococcus spelaei]
MYVTIRQFGAVLSPTRLGARVGRLGMQVLRLVMPSWGVFHVRVRESGVEGEWVGAVPEPGTRVVYYLHGSAYFSCSPGTHRGLIDRVGQACGRPVFALRYRLAPEHPFPAAHDDALAGYRWLLGRGHRPEDIVVAGDSAGGHLALGLAGELVRRGLPQPAALVLFSPVVDPTMTLAATREPAVRDPYAKAATGRRLIGMYLADADPADPRLDVASGAGPALAPMLVHVGGREVLQADAEHLAAASLAAGGRCELRVWPGQVHVFQAGYLAVPEAVDALAQVTRFVDEVDAQRV